MNRKVKKVIDIIVTIIPVLLILMSGFMKLTGAPQVVTKLTEIGVGPYVKMFGIMELVFAVLFIFPQTMRMGFILLSCYFAGAMATDLSHGITVANSMMVLVFVCVSALIRDRSVFMQVASKRKTSLQ